MKQKISISIEEATIGKIERKVFEGIYRNKSHLVEFAINKLLREKGQEGQTDAD